MRRKEVGPLPGTLHSDTIETAAFCVSYNFEELMPMQLKGTITIEHNHQPCRRSSLVNQCLPTGKQTRSKSISDLKVSELFSVCVAKHLRQLESFNEVRKSPMKS